MVEANLAARMQSACTERPGAWTTNVPTGFVRVPTIDVDVATTIRKRKLFHTRRENTLVYMCIMCYKVLGFTFAKVYIRVH